MIFLTKEIRVNSKAEDELIDITLEIRQFVEKSGVKVGSVTVFVPHTTAAVTINENCDPDVKLDFLTGMNQSFQRNKNYYHSEGNSHAHIKSSVIGVSEEILIDDSKLLLGTWQGVYFCEFDGPRTRRVILRVKGI
jgi:secondary thiamine-phosphate synthase enzyme